MRTTSFDQAIEALHLAEADPGRSVPAATALARAARRRGEYAAASVAERALGIAALHLRDADVAAKHLRAAVALGRRAGEPALVAEARLRLAAVLNVRGRPAAALREIEAAVTASTGIERARALAQHGAILVQLGRLDAALESLGAAVPELRAAGDRMWLKRALANRGLVNGRRFRFAAAEADLCEALRLNRDLGLDLSVAFVLQNLGWVATLRGEVPRALHHLDEAEEQLRKLGAQTGFLLEDRAALLLSVGLVGEAREAALAAVAALERERQRIALPGVRLLLSRAALLQDAPGEALAQARKALTELAPGDRPEWAALARYLVATARAAGDERSRVAPWALERAAGRLDEAGWVDVALQARMLAAELAAERGQADRALALLTVAGNARLRGPAATRALGWHAEALRRQGQGRRAGALRAARAGLRVLDEYRAGLGAADLRVHTGRQRGALASLGLRAALAVGRPAEILTWAEHGRASHLLLPPLLPPDDDRYAVDLAGLRAAVAEVAEARAAGVDPTAALRHQVGMERRIRDLARRQPGVAGAAQTAPTGPIGLPALGAALGGSALVEYVELDGVLGALTVVEGRAAWHRIGPVEPVRELLDRLPFALHRLASGRSVAALRLLRDAAERLDSLLLAPLLAPRPGSGERAGPGGVGDRPLVVVPTGRLQSLPWSLLPSCAGRPVTVAPSATTWQQGSTPTSGGAYRAVVLAGPGLPGARREADEVAAIHRTTALTGPAAAVETALELLAGADVAHLATHGTIHREHPLFSALLLADGPLTGYDLERLRPVPGLVVLAGCDTGRHSVRAGDELLGLTATFLARGARQVVASVLPVPDAETAPLMTAFHAGLVAGNPAARALADAQANLADGDAALAAAAGFVCIGGTFTLG